MQEDLTVLFKLQKIDQDLHEIEQLKVNIPHQIETMGGEQSDVEQRFSEQEQQVESLEKDRRQHERDLEGVQEQINKYQGQLHSVKTNKEYDALQKEMQTQKTNISVHEDAILQLMSDTEEAGEALEAIRVEMETTIAAIKIQTRKLKKKLTTVDEDVAVKRDERLRTAMRIEARVARVYNRIRRILGGLAVVPLKKGACGGCFNIIPLQVVAEIRQMNRLTICESCGRIVLVEEAVEV
jgi:predicted  nucleic acid-binding Zn-ribbon protein